jgi:hypothetical protein
MAPCSKAVSVGKAYSRNPEGDQKERPYVVLSMQMRPDVKVAKNNQ